MVGFRTTSEHPKRKKRALHILAAPGSQAKNLEQESRTTFEGSGLERVLTRVLELSAKAPSDRIFIPTTALQFPPSAASL